MSSFPFHVLMLPGSKPPGSEAATATAATAAATPAATAAAEAATADGGGGEPRQKDPQQHQPPPQQQPPPQPPQPPPPPQQQQQSQESEPREHIREKPQTVATSPSSPLPTPQETIPEDDYLLTRHRHQMSKVQESSSGIGNGGIGDSDERKKAKKDGTRSAGGKDRKAANGNGSSNSRKKGGSAEQSVPVCTPIEIAIINCCEIFRRERGENNISSAKKMDGSANSDGPMEGNGSVNESSSDARSPASSGTMNGNPGSSSSNPGSSSSSGGVGSVDSSSSGKNAATNGNYETHDILSSQMAVGYLAEGKEGQFASLIALNCHTISDRALALAVLERTTEHDKTMERRRHEHRRKRKRADLDSHNGNDDHGKSEEEQGSSLSSSTSTTTISEGNSSGSRMANFLSAGGLKVLSQWLVDSFTPIQAQPRPLQPTSKKGGSKRSKPKESQWVRDADTETSPTGPIILPLLSILESIPFRADLVIECRINRQVKKLKKNLEKVVIGASANKKDEFEKKLNSLDGDFSHPLSGGMPVVAVYKRMEEMMATWNRAMNDEKKRTDHGNGSGDRASALNPPPTNFYRDLRSKMTERLAILSKYEAGKGPKPTWLADLDPKAAAGKAKARDSEETARHRQMKEKAAASAKAAKEKVEEDKRQLEAKRRRIQLQEELNAENAAIEENRRKLEQYRRRLQDEGDQRKATETNKLEMEEKPQKREKGTSSRKVTWADQHSNNSTKLTEVKVFVQEEEVSQSEEDDKRKVDEETKGSESRDSDEFLGDESNPSQGGEAGFTFETQHIL